MSSASVLTPVAIDSPIDSGTGASASRSDPKLTVIIPARNEELRIGPTLEKLASEFSQLDHEVIIVDDGSTDGTVKLGKSMGAIVLSLGEHGGPGEAIRRGVAAAKGERLLICDADGAVPFEDIWPLWKALDEGSEIAVGSRALRPDWIEVPQPLHRRIMGRTWGKLVRTILPTAVRDTQCGFKLFTQASAKQLFGRCQSRGFAFYVEVLAMAECWGYGITELPVRWRDKPGSQIRLVADPMNMASELWQARRRVARLESKPPELHRI